MVNGFVIICYENFVIEKVLFNSFERKVNLLVGESFSTVFDSEDHSKVMRFAEELMKTGASFNWEMNVSFTDSIKPLKFTAGRLENNYFIIALETNNDMPFLYEELIKINNEQANHIRENVRERFQSDTGFRDHEETFHEMTRLNNDLANLQRELSRKNAELQRLNEVKDQFLGMAAHDLRNPMSNILFYTDFILEEKERLSDDQKEFVEQVQYLGRFMLGMVNDLLDVSAIESGNIRLSKREEDLVKLIEHTLTLNENHATRKGIELARELPDFPVLVHIDPEKISQVIINLLTNAVKFSPSETTIHVRLEVEEKSVRVIVTDEGQGIPQEELANLFKPFQKTSTQATNGEKSTGLGLYIVKRIVEAHGGDIRAKSPPGEGASFIFSLPME